ncbi:hypothetical protein F5141DRAFT_78682 [Pisolithus sp. B1]|nr:hypothetical protein F5141DRAFT_78682 [Pisolithus sp. B1]
MPGPMNTVCRSYSLTLGGWLAEVDGCSGQRIRLGDYGDCVDGILICSGNVFEDMRILGIDPQVSAYFPVVSRVHSDVDWRMSCDGIQADVTTAYHATRDTHLALRQAKGISLPTNKHFMLLLKAFSTRLAGKHLVTTIIQCSEFYSVDRAGNRRDSEDDSAPDSGNPRTEAGISTPLYAIASPQVWRRELPCAQRRERFKSIREHFYALYQPTGTERSGRFSNKRKKDRAITFFARLPLVAETDPPSDILSVCAIEEEGLLPHAPILSCADWSDARHEVVLRSLHRRCQDLRARYGSPRQKAADKQMRCELKTISRTLNVGLLKYICLTLERVCFELRYPGEAMGRENGIGYDRHLDTPSVVQQIEALQVKLDTTEDEDEQRALEEDVTGKILWLCWCGIRAEVDELLPKVMIKPTCGGSCIVREHPYQNMTCYLLLGRQSKPSGQVQILARPL